VLTLFLCITVDMSFDCMADCKLDRFCEIAEGRLTEKETLPESKVFHYEFEVAGIGYKGFQEVTGKAYNSHEEGDVIEIEYLPGDPSTNRPRGMSIRNCRKLTVFAAITAIVAAMFVYTIVDQRRKMKKERRELEKLRGKEA